MAMAGFLVGKMEKGEVVRDLWKAEEALKILQKAVDGVKNLANIRLGKVVGAEFGSRMNKMDTYMKELYVADPEKWIANYENGIKSGKKYNVLIEPDIKGTKLFPVFNGSKFKDSRGFDLRGTNDFVVMNGKIYFWENHSFIARWENVEFAWRAKFNDKWELLTLDNWSGHYQPRIEDKHIAIKAIKDLGFDASNIPFNSSSF